MRRVRSVAWVLLFEGVAACTRATAPSEAPRTAAREEMLEVDLDAASDDTASDAAPLDLPDACAPDDPSVTVRSRVAVYVTGASPSITDVTFTGPRSAARIRCAADLALRARDRAASDGMTIHAKVLRRCDERPLPTIVPGRRTPVELVRESSSSESASVRPLAVMHVPDSCLESNVASTQTDRNAFDALEACEGIRARLDAKDREAAASAKESALAWLDEQLASHGGDLARAREELAAFLAGAAADAHGKREPVAEEMRRIERERFETGVSNEEKLVAMVRERRDREANTPLVSGVKWACVRRTE